MGGIIVSFVLDWRLALIILAAIPLFILAMTVIMKKSVPLYRDVQSRLDGLSRIIRENLSGVRVIRAFGKTEGENKRFEGELDEFTKASVRVAKVSVLLNPITTLIMNAAIIAIIAVTGINASGSGDVSTGTIVALINYANQILVALIVVSNLVVTFSKAYASGNRVAELLSIDSEIESGKREISSFSGDETAIEFKNVFFSYGDGEDELEDVSFSVKKGQTIGIIGTTGAGKTTVINLIPRFYDVKRGEIFINGHDIREYDLDSLRRCIAVVPQKIQLFSGTVEQNIRYGKPDASEEEIRKAARVAQADGFISAKPQGYSSVIERGGVNFSGGQRQRIAIARALVRDAEILILDDSSSALDYSTDAAIREGIAREYSGKTLIIVSQRVNTIMNADKIILLDNGRVIAEGTHDQLVKESDFYREICASQQIRAGAA